jgi:hypothetical protein
MESHYLEVKKQALLEKIKLQNHEWSQEKQALLDIGYVVCALDWSLIPWTAPSHFDDVSKLEQTMTKLNMGHTSGGK